MALSTSRCELRRVNIFISHNFESRRESLREHVRTAVTQSTMMREERSSLTVLDDDPIA
jgi:hypothetical protein